MSESTAAAVGARLTRPASLTVALATGVGLVVASVTSGATAGVALTAAAGVALGVTTLVGTHDGPAAATAGAALTPFVAVGGVAGVVLVAAERGALGGGPVAALPAVALAVGAGVAAFGAAGTLAGGAVRRTFRSVAATVTVVGLAFVALLAARIDAISVPDLAPGALLDPVLSPGGPTTALVTFFGLVVAAALACRWALSALPITELLPRARRQAAERVVTRLDADCRALTKYGVVAASASLPTAIPAVREALPVAGVAALVVPTGPRLLLFTVTLVAAVLALAARFLRAAAGTTAATLGRLLPATAGGVLVVLVAVGAGGRTRAAVEGLPPAVRPVAADLLAAFSPAGLVLGIAVSVLVALLGVLMALRVALWIDLVPARDRGGALAGAGLSTCAVVLGAGEAPALATFALVGLGVVAWDVSDQARAVRADLGRSSAGGLEAVHAVGSVATATAGVGVAWASLGLVGVVALPDGALVGAVAAVAAAVILLGVVRA
ncbi:hypothetical protein DU504_06785 [Haloplanus salinus]|jgi:hypothetical protein|uniref:Uncharacterized protein n=1 Tax=Haloplanus salinus TaxID=1126245 RepID=A0A368NBR8_9EURY|nr:hypothetical protein [Haloplanus salinus]RCU47035.1 hypothetical protein DU504_06785 [Haloplanus salinus]